MQFILPDFHGKVGSRTTMNKPSTKQSTVRIQDSFVLSMVGPSTPFALETFHMKPILSIACTVGSSRPPRVPQTKPKISIQFGRDDIQRTCKTRSLFVGWMVFVWVFFVLHYSNRTNWMPWSASFLTCTRGSVKNPLPKDPIPGIRAARVKSCKI